jgi:hypothetical protein
MILFITIQKLVQEGPQAPILAHLSLEDLMIRCNYLEQIPDVIVEVTVSLAHLILLLGR